MGFCYYLKFWYAAIRDGGLLFLFIIYCYLGVLWKWFFPPKPKSLKGEIILITGSANGIGRQICLQLVKSGAKLVCWDISKRENTALVIELKSLGANATGYDVDVSDIHQVQMGAAKVKEEIGDVSILINNAGVMPVHKFLSHNPREITRAFSVNVYGPMWLLREFLPSMIEKRKGHVVTICSCTGLIGARNLVAYSGTMHANNGVIESLRDELRIHQSKPDVKFTTVYPSPCNTTFATNLIYSRFPWVLPVMSEPGFVAQSAIEGIRLNKDYVYVPSALNLLLRIMKASPTKVHWAIMDFFNFYVEPRENTRTIIATPSKANSSRR